MTMSEPITEQTNSVASDLLRGADQIAGFLFGSPDERRKVYHLAETSRLPIFRLGAVLCARRSVLLSWIAQQERRGINEQSGLSTQTAPPVLAAAVTHRPTYAAAVRS